MTNRQAKDSGEKVSAEMSAAMVRVSILEIRVGAVRTSVKTLRKQISGDDVKR